MAAIDDTLREIATMAKQQDAKTAAATAPPAGGIKSLVMSLPIGTNVLDLVTGEQGVIVDGKRENVIIPLAG